MGSVPTTRESLGIFWEGDEVDGVLFYGLWSEEEAAPDGLLAAWPRSTGHRVRRLFGPGWVVRMWEVRVVDWPSADAWGELVLGTLRGITDAGACVAWGGLEGFFVDPPALLRDGTDGVWCARTGSGAEFGPPSLDGPFTLLDADAVSALAQGAAEVGGVGEGAATRRPWVEKLLANLRATDAATRDRSADEVTEVCRSLTAEDLAALTHTLVSARMVEQVEGCQEAQLHALIELATWHELDSALLQPLLTLQGESLPVWHAEYMADLFDWPPPGADARPLAELSAEAIAWESSYLLGWTSSEDEVRLRLEVRLLEAHPRFRKVDAGLAGCFALADLTLLGVTELRGLPEARRAARWDANLREFRDAFEIDGAEFSDGEVVFDCDGTLVRVACSSWSIWYRGPARAGAFARGATEE